MDNRIQDVVIVGGGTAGWMTASYLSAVLQGSVKITVIESPMIPRIGVGEATVPNLQPAFFNALGLSEDEWMRGCNASFKTAVRLVNWRRPREEGEEWFYHPFGLLPTCDGMPLSHYWVMRRHAGDTQPYDYACFKEPPMMDARLSPRYLDGRRATRYAWHFDAHLVAEYLKDFSVRRHGAIHVLDEIAGVSLDERGHIASLSTTRGRTIRGDLFVDCSGFRGLLINKAMGEPFMDMSDHLLCDSAVACPVPHDDARYGIEPYTSAIAMKAGWTWKIPMLGRFGSGYVYSSQFCSVDQAARDFCELWGLDPATAPLNKIRFRVGRNRRAWVKNCVSIGLSSCFLEPLESTGIYFIYASIFQLAKHFPDRDFDQTLIDRFNTEIELMFDDSRDFIQAHYLASPREDTPFWRANHELETSDNIDDKLAMFRAGLPINMPVADEQSYYGNFEAEFRNFWTNGSYYCILGGLGVLPQSLPTLRYRPASQAKAEAIFTDVRRQQDALVNTLPTMYEFLHMLHGREEPPWRRAELAQAAAT
jgi:tryptophan 6-halogenase